MTYHTQFSETLSLTLAKTPPSLNASAVLARGRVRCATLPTVQRTASHFSRVGAASVCLSVLCASALHTGALAQTAQKVQSAQTASAAPSLASPPTLKLYSARHYSTDEALYNDFTKATGVKIERIDADDAGILARLKAEGAASPADVILLVDAARLWRAEVDGLFAPIKSPLLQKNLAAQNRSKDTPEGNTWFGFSSRARVVVYNKVSVKPEQVATYAQLAAPELKGKFCSRSGSHPYNLSLFSAVYEREGAAKTRDWLQGLVANQARAPKGGDTDQIKAVASGECGAAIANSYYVARILKSNKPEDVAMAQKFGVVFPNQTTWGTHFNVAGGGVALHSKNKAAAQQFLEYLASPSAQRYFAQGNNEWPLALASQKSADAVDPVLQKLVPPNLKIDTTPVGTLGMNQVKVQQLLDQVGFK